MRTGRVIALCSLFSWITGSALAAALALLAPWLCEHTLAAQHLTADLQTSAPLLLFSGVSGSQIGVLSGFGAFKDIARVSLLSGLLNFPLTVGGAFLFGLTGIIWGMILAQVGACLLNVHAIRSQTIHFRIPISYLSCLDELQIVWQFSIPAVLAAVLMSAVSWACAAMFVRQPSGYPEMGAFNAANQWFNALMWLPYVCGSVALPMIAEHVGAADSANSGKLLRLSMKVNGAVALPLMAIGCLFSPLIMRTYGKDFESAWITLIAVLITAALVAVVQVPVGQFIAASGRMWLGLAMNAVWASVFVGTSWLLLGWGALGLASARLVAYLAHGIWLFVYSATAVHGIDAGTKPEKHANFASG